MSSYYLKRSVVFLDSVAALQDRCPNSSEHALTSWALENEFFTACDVSHILSSGVFYELNNDRDVQRKPRYSSVRFSALLWEPFMLFCNVI